MQSLTPTPGYTVTRISYTVPSATAPGTVYTVSVDPTDQRMTCTCPATRQCWHAKAVIAGVAGKPRVRLVNRPQPAVAAPSDDFFSDGGAALDVAVRRQRAS